MQKKQKSSFPGSLAAVAFAVLVVLAIQAGAGAGGDGAGTTAVAALASGDQLSDPAVPGLDADTTVTAAPQATDPETTLVTATDPPTTDPPTTAPPPTDPPTTAPPPTDPPTTAPPPTDPPTTAPPPTDPPTTAPPTTEPVVIGPNTLPPPSTPGGNPPNAGSGGSVAIGGTNTASPIAAPAAAFKSVVATIGSTAAKAAEHMIAPAVRKLVQLPAVRQLTESQPVAATRKAVALVTEELRDLKPASVAPYLWMALLALLVTTGAFLRLWWAPPEWPSSRSLAVGAHRRAGASPRGELGWGWPASPPPLPQRAAGGWRPPLPGATGLAARRLPPRLGIDVDRLRAAPPPGKPVFTGQDEGEPGD